MDPTNFRKPLLETKFLPDGYPPVVILYSGGLDTYIVLRGLLQHYEGQEHLIHSLTIDYGQRNWRELQIAKYVCRKYGVTMYRNPLLQLPILRGAGASMVAGHTGYREDENMKTRKGTNVANRNIIFIAYAAAYAETVGAQRIYWGELDIKTEALNDSRPDSTYETLTAMREVCRHSLYDPVELIGPFSRYTKAQMLERARDSGVSMDWTETYTCFTNSWPPCGECRSCKERAAAFETAGMVDTTYPYPWESYPQNRRPKDRD